MPTEEDMVPGGSGRPWQGSGRIGWFGGELLSLVPLVAIVALVGMVGMLMWFLRADEEERMRAQLASDALWVEQTLRFQLSQDSDFLARLSLDEASGAEPAVLMSRARLHIANDPEVLGIRWTDPAGRVTAQLPLAAPPGTEVPLDSARAALLRQASLRGVQPVFGALDPRALSVRMLVMRANGAGAIEMEISLTTLVDRHIPWWIAERYAVELIGQGDRVLVERARMTPPPEAPQDTIGFDPPFPGAALRITPFSWGAPLSDRLLAAGIGVLALVSAVALAVLFRSTRQRRRAEQRLRAEMAFRRSMEESLTVGLRAKDHEGRVIYVNGAFGRMVGFAPQELVGLPLPMPYWAPDRLEETLARQAALRQNGLRTQAFETRFRRRDGAEIDVQVYEAPLVDAAGVHRGWMGSIIDITAAKDAERRARDQEASLTRTARLVTLGEMASTLAHELNQPLAAIASYAAGARNMLAAGRSDPALLTPALEKLSQQADRAGQIIRGIQGLVRKRAPNFSRLSLAPVITETAAFLAADARARGIAVDLRLGPAPEVAADRILLEQVLINLLRNGMEAMAGARVPGQRITVRLGAAPAEGGDASAAERPGAEILVEDAGSGIAPDIAARVFDAFVSTKTEGMGIGLNVCRSIMELHQGRIAHSPRPGGGTVFRLWLPAVPDAAPAEDPALPVPDQTPPHTLPQTQSTPGKPR